MGNSKNVNLVGVMRTSDLLGTACKVLARGLGWPNSPTIAPDGRIFFTETFRGQVSVWENGRDVYTHAHTGGGPHACVLNPDGSLIVAQNGGAAGTWRAEKMLRPSIQWVSPDGQCVQEFATDVDGICLNGPSDLVRSADGWLYFADSGGYCNEGVQPSRIFRVDSTGLGELIMEIEPPHCLSSVAISHSGSLIWIDPPTGFVKELSHGKLRSIAQLPHGASAIDAISISADNRLYVTSLNGACVDVFSLSGECIERYSWGGLPTNCAFDVSGNLIVTDAGIYPDSPYPQFLGNLLAIDLSVVNSSGCTNDSEDKINDYR